MGVGGKIIRRKGQGVREGRVMMSCCSARPVSSDWDWRLLPGLGDRLWYR